MIAGHEAEGAGAGWGVVGEEEATAKIVHPNKRGLRETEVKHSISSINAATGYINVSHCVDLLKLAPDRCGAINGRCSSGNIQANVSERHGLKNGLTEREGYGPGHRHAAQGSTGGESSAADLGHALREGHSGQGRAVSKGVAANAPQIGGKRKGRQGCAARKGAVFNLSHALGNLHRGQRRATSKGIIADDGHTATDLYFLDLALTHRPGRRMGGGIVRDPTVTREGQGARGGLISPFYRRAATTTARQRAILRLQGVATEHRH